MESLLNAALQYLSRRPRSEKEIRAYLQKKLQKRACIIAKGKDEEVLLQMRKVLSEEIEQVVSRLRELHFIDDFAFAKWWVEQRTRVKPKGWHAILFELRQKGITQNVIDDIKEEIARGIDEAKASLDAGVLAQDSARNEFSLALELAKKKMRIIGTLPREKVYQRLGGFLGRRGFSMDTIRRVFDEVLPKSV